MARTGAKTLLPYRMIFAVASIDSVVLYDTLQNHPILFVEGIHYTQLTDLRWGADGRHLSISSTDGFCTIASFEEDELGTPLSREGIHLALIFVNCYLQLIYHSLDLQRFGLSREPIVLGKEAAADHRSVKAYTPNEKQSSVDVSAPSPNQSHRRIRPQLISPETTMDCEASVPAPAVQSQNNTPRRVVPTLLTTDPAGKQS